MRGYGFAGVRGKGSNPYTCFRVLGVGFNTEARPEIEGKMGLDVSGRIERDN